MGTEQAASLHYDEESGYLLLAAHGDDWLNRMYAIHPQSLTVAELGDFGDNVWPVVCLYQYQRPQELTVKMRPATAEIFEEDSLQLTASVVPSRYQDQWPGDCAPQRHGYHHRYIGRCRCPGQTRFRRLYHNSERTGVHPDEGQRAGDDG